MTDWDTPKNLYHEERREREGERILTTIKMREMSSLVRSTCYLKDSIIINYHNIISIKDS